MVAASPVAAVLVLAAGWTPAAVPLMAVITTALAVVTTLAMRRFVYDSRDAPDERSRPLA